MKKFNISLNGYDKQEVNQFVGEVTREYELMLGKLKNKDKEISLLEEQLTHYKGLESTLNRAMLVAEDSSSQLKQVAKEEAKNIIEDAKKNASYIVNDALIKAEKIESKVVQNIPDLDSFWVDSTPKKEEIEKLINSTMP